MRASYSGAALGRLIGMQEIIGGLYRPTRHIIGGPLVDVPVNLLLLPYMR